MFMRKTRENLLVWDNPWGTAVSGAPRPPVLRAPLQRGFLLWLLPPRLVPAPDPCQLPLNPSTLALCVVRFRTSHKSKQVRLSKNQTPGGRGR